MALLESAEPLAWSVIAGAWWPRWWTQVTSGLVALNPVRTGTPQTGIMPWKCFCGTRCVTQPSAVRGWTGGVSVTGSGLGIGIPSSALSWTWLSQILCEEGLFPLLWFFLWLLLHLDFLLPRSCRGNSTWWKLVVVGTLNLCDLGNWELLLAIKKKKAFKIIWARQFCRKQSILELNLDHVALLSFRFWSKRPD